MSVKKPCHIVNKQTGEVTFLGEVEDKVECQILALDYVNKYESEEEDLDSEANSNFLKEAI
jgi:hypothetical protein